MLNPYRGLPKSVYIIAASRVISAAGSFVFPLLTLILTKKIGLSDYDAGLLISSSGILFMFSGIIGGKLTDNFGRKKIITVFVGIGAVCYIISAFLGTSRALIAFIMLAGFFMGVSDPASSALVADITTPKNRDSAYSLFYMASNIGYAISPTVGGILFENHLKILFIINGIASIASVIIIYLYVPEPKDSEREICEEGRKLETGVKGSTLSVLLKRPVLLFYALVMFGYSFVYSQWGFMYPILSERVAPENGARLYGTLVSFNALPVIFLTPFITKLLSRKNSLRRIFYGGILYTIGFGMPGFASMIPFLFLSTFIMTLGEITVTISTSPFVANHTPSSHRGRIGAVIPIITGTGYTIGPSVMGKISSLTNMNNVWRIIGFVMMTFTLLALMLERYDNRVSADPE